MNTNKFLVEIYRRGEHNDAIIQMVTNHNEGKISLSFDIIKGYMTGRYCQYPTLMPSIETKQNIGAKTMQIVEGEKPTLLLTIVNIPVEELKTTYEKDLSTNEVKTIEL